MALWTPANLAVPASGWYKADDAATLTLSGSNVTEWRDKSGNGRHATQATAANQPLSGSDTIDGKNVLTFGDTDFLDLPAMGISGSDNRFVIALTNAAVAGSNRAIITLGGSGGTGGRWSFRETASVLRIEIRGSGYTSSLASTGAAVQACGLDGTTLGGHVLWLNGTSESATGANAVNTSDTDNVIGKTQTSSTPLGTRLYAELVVLDYYPDTDERQRLEGYLAWEWSLEASLPGGHPYFSAAPETGGGGVTGEGAVTAPAATGAGAGTPVASGTAAATAPAATTTGTGAPVITGSGAVTAPGAVTSGAGAPVIAGSGAATAPAAEASGSSGTVTGTSAVTAPAATVSAAGTTVVTGAAAVTAASAEAGTPSVLVVRAVPRLRHLRRVAIRNTA